MGTGTSVPNRLWHNKMVFHETYFSKKCWSGPSRSLFDNRFDRMVSTCKRSRATHKQSIIPRQGVGFLRLKLTHAPDTPENLTEGSDDVPRQQN